MSEKQKFNIHLGETDTTPENVSYYPEALNTLDAHFAKLISKNDLQCASYLLAKEGRIFACKSMGKHRYNDENSEFMPDSIRRIASITKAFTAVATMQLIEKGLIFLNQPVCTILKEFDTPKHKTITIMHLLTHTSGLRADPNFYLDAYTLKWWESIEDNNWIKAYLSGTPHCEPGKAWIYSSTCFSILGEIIQRLSGVSYEQYVIENIVRPLKMTRTFFKVPEELKGQVCTTNEWDEKGLDSKKDETDTAHSAGGGLYSSLYDLFRFGQMLLNKGTLDGAIILGRKTVESMTRNYLHENIPNCGWGGRVENFSYGLGLHIMPEVFLSVGTFSHEGAGRSALYMDPAENFLAAYFIPGNIEWVPEAMVATKAVIWSGII